MGTVRQEELLVFQSPGVLYEDNCKTIETYRNIYRWFSANFNFMLANI